MNLPIVCSVRRLLCHAILCLTVIGCTSSASHKSAEKAQSSEATTPQQNSPGWSARMQSLSQTLSSLLPLVSSKAKFNDEKNLAQIEKDTQQLRSLAHSLKSTDAPNQDPSMRVMTGLFEEDIARALEALKSGNRDYARHVLKDTTAYCIQCHTQTETGPKFPYLKLDLKTSDLKPIEQAQFYAATRQFDRALAAYETALNADLAKNEPFEWENSARSALAITVRVKKDPKEALALTTRLDQTPTLPDSTKSAIKVWKKTIQEWQKEKKVKNQSAEVLLVNAEAQIQRAQARQEFPLDHSQDVLYFRASSSLHELLEAGKHSAETTARILYNAGLASEATRDLNFWTLHETFYEQCIRKQPHSPLAAKCFARLSESVTLGYSGSAGVKLPTDVVRRLNVFRELAEKQ